MRNVQGHGSYYAIQGSGLVEGLQFRVQGWGLRVWGIVKGNFTLQRILLAAQCYILPGPLIRLHLT